MDMKSVKLQLLVVLLAVLVSGGLAHRFYKRGQFVNRLHLVDFSTSLLSGAGPEEEQRARDEAAALGIDLCDVYEESHLLGTPRLDLAWLLISEESPEYLASASRHIKDIHWPEVRIWIHRQSDDSLSLACRAKLHELILRSPTTEGRLSAGRWYLRQGRKQQAESAFLDVLQQGPSFVSLDAAMALADSPRYRETAIEHLLSTVKSPYFAVENLAARRLGSLLNKTDAITPVVRSYELSPTPRNREALVKKLEELVRQDAQSNARRELDQ